MDANEATYFSNDYLLPKILAPKLTRQMTKIMKTDIPLQIFTKHSLVRHKA